MAKININVNKLQNDISKMIRRVERGDICEVSRYSKPVAYLISKRDYDHLVTNHDCKKCIADLRRISKKLEE